jgi:hypothetical protein
MRPNVNHKRPSSTVRRLSSINDREFEIENLEALLVTSPLLKYNVRRQAGGVCQLS